MVLMGHKACGAPASSEEFILVYHGGLHTNLSFIELITSIYVLSRNTHSVTSCDSTLRCQSPKLVTNS